MIKEIARLAGLSESGVRRALKDFPDIPEATKARVRALAEQVGYRPSIMARALVMKRSMLLGILVPELAISFFPEIIDGLESVARQKGYQLLIAKHEYDDARLAASVEVFSRWQVDGLFLAPGRSALPPEVLRELKNFKKPLVLFDEALEGKSAAAHGVWVGIDDEAAARSATEHLLAKGRRRIAFAGAHAGSLCSKRRVRGFEQALRKAGRPVMKPFVAVDQPDEHCGRLAAAQILGQPDAPDAVLCHNDAVATGLMLALLAAGRRIPEDFSIMGFGNLNHGHALPVPLSTVDQSTRAMGAALFEAFESQLAGGKARKTILVPSTLVERESVRGKT